VPQTRQRIQEDEALNRQAQEGQCNHGDTHSTPAALLRKSQRRWQQLKGGTSGQQRDNNHAHGKPPADATMRVVQRYWQQRQ
jgi:hypothetical protein